MRTKTRTKLTPIGTLACPPSVRSAERFELGSLTFVLFDLGPPISLPPELTSTEAELVRALFHGESGAEIARKRRVSYRTVANQLASIYRKLGVNSAVEALALLQERQKFGRG